MALKGINGTAVAATAFGALLLYSGIKGKSFSSALRNVLAGQSPAQAFSANPITIGGAGGPGSALGSVPSISGTGANVPKGAGYVGPRKAYLALRAEGIPQSAAIMLTAIAGVESGWNTHAVNNTPSTGDLSIGVWQENYFGSLGPARTQLFGMGPQELLNSGLPGQARATAILYRQDGLGPWMPDITSGKVNQFMGQAQAAAR
jgi:hypothetical protein